MSERSETTGKMGEREFFLDHAVLVTDPMSRHRDALWQNFPGICRPMWHEGSHLFPVFSFSLFRVFLLVRTGHAIPG